MNHTTTPLQYLLGDTVNIDEQIAPVVTAIWQLGLRTTSSCQGDPGGDLAHLIMPTEDAIRLLNLISSLAPNDDGDEGDELGFSKLYYRIAPWEQVTHSHPGRWFYSTRFLREQPGDFIHASTYIEFPHDDLPVLEPLLRRAVAYKRGDDMPEGDDPRIEDTQ